jgi:HK97 gp10 family phage protein
MSDAVKRAVVAEVEKGTYDVEARSKQLAPVLTGTLRRSIHSLIDKGGLRGTVGPSVDYGIFVEFGTRHMAPRPYMRPAAERVLPGTLDAIKRAIAGLR